MKIKTRLRLNTWISLGAVVFILLSLLWSLKEADRADQNVLLVDAMKKTAFERVILRDDWLLNQESRARMQWDAKTKALRELLESAFQRFAGEEARLILKDTRGDFEMTASSFSTILEKYKQNKLTAKNKFGFTEADSRLISQVFLKAYSLNDNISRLHEYSRAAAITARDRWIALSFFLVFCIIAWIVINSSIINRLIAKRLKALNEGIVIIGGGNLDYRIDETGNDELADLARAGNEMAVRLQHSHTSIEKLKKEITERKTAEKNIKMLSLHQQVLLSAIPDIIMEVDVNKIYTWANEPGFAFFGKDVIGKSADFYFLREQNTFAIVQPIFNGSEDIIYVESWQKREDGQERLLAWWCRVLKDVQGNVTGALSTARDITERRLATEEIKRLNEELEQRVLLRTAELAAKNTELERLNKVFVDRELRMRELKEQIAELESRSS